MADGSRWSSLSQAGKNSPSAKMGGDRETYKCLVRITGKTLNAHKYILDHLHKEIRLQAVSTEDECDFILVFCPVVSRAGTDIEAAVNMLHKNSNIKPAVLVVLHHTFDPECVVPDSSRAVNRKNTTVVDCLFHEDMGLLQCTKNRQSLSKIIAVITSQVKGQCTKLNNQKEGVTSDMELRSRERTQHERDQQPTLKRGYRQDRQIHVKKLKKNLEERQKELNKEKEELKDFEECLQNEEKTLSEILGELEKTTDKLQKATEQIEEKNSELDKLKQELQDKKKEVEKIKTVQEQLNTELSGKNKEIQKKDRYLVENAKTLQMKDEALEEKDTQLKQIKTELEETIKKLEESQRHMEEKNTQLENMNKLLREKETQLKKTDKEPETSKNKLETLGEELLDKKRQLQEQMIVLEQQKTEIAEKNKQLEEKERLLTERQTQLMERDKQLQEKDKTLEEKDTLLREVKEELRKANRMSDENQTQMKDSDRERKLENVGKEPETSKQNLLEKEKQIWEKDRPLAETREQKGAQCKQEEEQVEEEGVIIEAYKYLVHITGKTLDAHKDILYHLNKEIRLQEVSTEDECDFILVFCPVVSRAGTDIEAAVNMLHKNSNIKPAVLVVLHHTFDPECVVPDSSRAVNRKNTIVVDCLFHEDTGLLWCTKNHQSLSKIITDIKSQVKGRCTKLNKQEEVVTSEIKYFEFDPGNVGRTCKKFTERLKKERKSMKRVTEPKDCEAVLLYWPIVSRAGTDIQAALQKINSDYKGKYVALVLLHHTFDPETIVPDSRRTVNSENQGGAENPIVVDCLFHEDMELLPCPKNDEAVEKVAAWLHRVKKGKPKKK